MNKYDFDTVIDRRGTSARKYEWLDGMFGRHDVPTLSTAYAGVSTIPFWAITRVRTVFGSHWPNGLPTVIP